MSTTRAVNVAFLVLLGVSLCCASRALVDPEGTGHSLVGGRHSVVVPAGSEGEEIHHPVFYTYNSRYNVESRDGYDGEKYYGYRSKLDGRGDVKDCGHGKEDGGNHDNGEKEYQHNHYGGYRDDGKKGTNGGHGSNDDDGKKRGGCKDGHDSKDGDVSMRDDDSYGGDGERKKYVTDGEWHQVGPYKYSDSTRERP